MHSHDACLTAAMRSLEQIADANASGTRICMKAFNSDPCEETERLLSQSLAFALSQPAYLQRDLLLWCIDSEIAASKQLS